MVKFRTERIGEFGGEPVETTLSVFQSLTQAEALNYLPEDDMVMEVLWNDKVWHHVVLHILDKGGLDEARLSRSNEQWTTISKQNALTKKHLKSTEKETD